jgi:hypothetical protein
MLAPVSAARDCLPFLGIAALRKPPALSRALASGYRLLPLCALLGKAHLGVPLAERVAAGLPAGPPASEHPAGRRAASPHHPTQDRYRPCDRTQPSHGDQGPGGHSRRHRAASGQYHHPGRGGASAERRMAARARACARWNWPAPTRTERRTVVNSIPRIRRLPAVLARLVGALVACAVWAGAWNGAGSAS